MVRLLPDSTEPIRERQLVGAGTLLFHVLLVWLLLHSAAAGISGVADASQGDRDGDLLVEYIAVPPGPSRLHAHRVVSSAKNASPASTSRQEGTATEVVEENEHANVHGKSGEDAAVSPALQAQPANRTASAAASAGSSAEGSRQNDDLLGSYHAALRAAIQRQWTEQTGRPFPSGCVIRLIQSVGGTVSASSATGCGLPQQERLQLEAAALMAQPLPYAGYEAVFAQDMSLRL